MAVPIEYNVVNQVEIKNLEYRTSDALLNDYLHCLDITTYFTWDSRVCMVFVMYNYDMKNHVVTNFSIGDELYVYDRVDEDEEEDSWYLTDKQKEYIRKEFLKDKKFLEFLRVTDIALKTQI